MATMWKHFDSGAKSARANMDLDAKLLEELDPTGPAILHLYRWERASFTYGYFIKPELYVDLDLCIKMGLDFARRPTGGGIVFHLSDLAFSVLVPSEHEGYSDNILENYQYINDKVREAVALAFDRSTCQLLPDEVSPREESFSKFCMAKPTIYDVMLGEKKIAGSAQRKRKQGYLHQGSVTLCLPDHELLQKILSPSPHVLESMQQHTLELSSPDPSTLQKAKELIQSQLKKVFS